jgi:hypothetical protein
LSQPIFDPFTGNTYNDQGQVVSSPQEDIGSTPGSPSPARFRGAGRGEEPESTSRFVQSVERAVAPIEELSIEQMFRDAGVDLDEPIVQGYITKATADLRAAETEQEATLVVSQIQAYLPALAEKWPSTPLTAYAQALAMSGFSGPLTQLGVTTPSEVTGVTPSQLVAGGTFAINPDTGWMQYANGVLVDPNVPLGAVGGVAFRPDSDAPGSPIWLRQVQTSWSPEQIGSWKKRLQEYGFISKDQAKTQGIDATFLDALRRYHELRYQNGGKPLATDLTGAEGTDEFNLTARDFQVQIRNDVREQYRATFGNDPSDAELEEWTRFVTQTSLRAQKALGRKGAPPSTALSLGATEAEERLIEELQGSPEATLLRESAEENTSLRDALATAVVTTRSLAG